MAQLLTCSPLFASLPTIEMVLFTLCDHQRGGTYTNAEHLHKPVDFTDIGT